MHTSTRLCAQDFHYWRRVAGGNQPPEGNQPEVGDLGQAFDFDTVFPNYHEQDRIGVVSVGLEEGVLGASYALLAFTTAFYDRLRARQQSFFDYPQHFAFVGVTPSHAQGIGAQVKVGDSVLPLQTPQLWNAWSWLDVWPDPKWVTAPATAAGMMQRLFDYQINRIFWPRALEVTGIGDQVPSHIWKMMRTSVKSVYLYGEADNAGDALGREMVVERLEIRVDAAAQEIVQESVVQLPAPLLLESRPALSRAPTAPQCYDKLEVTTFFDAAERLVAV